MRRLGGGRKLKGNVMLLRPHANATAIEDRPPALDWEAGYVRYRPMLFHALSKLARQGLVARPDDGLDLIHDFFSETWLVIARRFDPSKGKFEPYLYACFLYFARPRLARLLRWHDSLVPLEELAELSDRRTQVEARPHDHDLSAIRRALDLLPEFDREVLLAYVTSGKTSERQLADRFKITRFHLRSSLADALSNVAINLKEPTAFGEIEWAVLSHLSQERRTVKETARALNLTVSEVQAVRARILSRLLNAAKVSPRRTRMASLPVNPEALLMEALVSSADGKTIVPLIRRHAPEIISFLESDKATAFFEKHFQKLDGDRIAMLYETLGLEGGLDPEDRELCESFLVASRAEEKQIGIAFRDLLLPALPIKGTDFDRLFLGAEPISEDRRLIIEKEVSVVNGGAQARALAKFGITPVIVLEACEGISNLAQRYCKAHSVSVGKFVILDNSGKDTSRYKDPVLPRSESIREVMLMTELADKQAEMLFGWISLVGQYIPRLFSGFDAALWGDQLRLHRTDETSANLFEVWSPVPPQEIAA